MKITDLTHDKRNARKRTKRGHLVIEQSLRKLGAGRSIVIDKFGQIIAGNGVIENAERAGITDVEVIPSDGSRIIAVQRTDLDLDADPKARELAIADNRSAEFAEWDADTLADLASSVNLQPYFSADELVKMTGADNGSSVDRPNLFADEQVIETAFRFFRETGFPYRSLPLHVCMQELNKLAATDMDELIRTNTASQVPDTFHPHRYHAAAKGMKAPFDAFADDKLLRRALKLELETGSIGQGYFGALNIVSGTQSCSNFRPGFAAYLYRKYCKSGDTVLDTSTGYGGRLTGFLASGIAGKYIGIDPNVPTHQGNTKLAADLGFSDAVELHNLPAEDVPHDVVAGRCDFSFTSPPYFCKEIYSTDDTQSCNRYKSGEAWRDGFLIPMLRLQFAALKSGSTAIVNIADVKIGNTTYPLANWTRECGQQVGFRYLRTDEFPMHRRVGKGMSDEIATEPVIVFERP